MYEILKLKWDEVTDSNYDVSCDYTHRVATLKGKTFNECYSKRSTTVIFYNHLTGLPMFAAERIPWDEVPNLPNPLLEVPGYVVTVNIIKNNKGEEEYFDVVCTREDFYQKILQSNDRPAIE